MFKRKIYEELKVWKEKYAGKYALLIEGPRRVGKSTIIKEFVKNEYKSHIIINFEEVNEDVKNLFHNMMNLDEFFLLLQQDLNVKLYERKSAIVFDEVQLFPRARQSIKTLVKDGRYDYYETGSLISIKKNVVDILIPSEEHTIYMHPMDFEEFLWANGKEDTMPLIQDAFNKKKPLGKDLHAYLMKLYNTYMLVGGMPKVVSTYIKQNNFADVESEKKSILELYMKDVAKLDVGKRSDKSKSVLSSIPSRLEKHDKIFSPGTIKKDSSIRDYRRTISELEDSMIVNVCYRSTEPAIDQECHCDRDDLKMYLCDTGLLFTLSFNTLKYDSNEIYRNILNGKLDLNRGMYFENMVSQELVMSGHKLFFSKFMHKESTKQQEVDFIIVVGRTPVPIEVKSGKKEKLHKSLNRYLDKYKKKVNSAYVVCTKDLEIIDNIIYIPIYMTSLL